MLISSFKNIGISAISCAVPTQEITAESVYSEHGQEYTDKIKKTIGVNTIRMSVKKQIASDLGYVAAKKIIDHKGINPLDIGILVFVSQSHDYRLPATSCILHNRLGLSVDCAAVDTNNGCSGFIYGSFIICSMLNSANCKHALLITGDTNTPKRKTKEYLDKRVSVPFGDGTAAVLFSKCDTAHTIDISLRTDGKGYHSLIHFNKSFRSLTYTDEELALGNRNVDFTLMNGKEVFKFTLTDVPKHVLEFLSHQNKKITDYDCVALHQPNLYMIQQMAKRIGADMKCVPLSIDKYGNTSSASIPLTLVDKYGSLDKGTINTLMCGFGVGLYWGVMSANLDIDNILPMEFSDDYFVDPNLDLYEYD